MNYNKFFETQLVNIKNEGRYRIFLDIERCAGQFPKAIAHLDGLAKEVTIWCSNDYLGMGQHDDVTTAMKKAIDQCGAGSGGTRNISGTSHYHTLVEQALCHLHNKAAALIFTSGYVANEAALSTLGNHLPECIMLSDEKNHASIIQGIRHSRADKVIFRHNDLDHLEQLLQHIDPARPKIIVFESIYSMDGDIGHIKSVAALAKRYNALTYLDEVHGVGIYGNRGGGLTQQYNLENDIDIIQGTFGKAFGLIGGYIVASKYVTDFIRSFAPGFIFTTSLPPAILAGVLASINHLMLSHTERQQHQQNVLYLKAELDRYSIPFISNDSHIVPIVIGDAKLCKKVSDQLLNKYAIYAQPINYPTVPKGTERLRLTPSARHTSQMIDELVRALKEIWLEFRLNQTA